MKPDHELLEAAAKAAGMEPSEDGVIYAGFGSREWNPITSVADRYELCKKLGLTLDFEHNAVIKGSDYAAWADEDEGRVIVEFAGRVR